MKKSILLLSIGVIIAGTVFNSCKKTETTSNSDYETMQQNVLTDFVNVLGKPMYAQFLEEATTLNSTVHDLANNPTTENQQKAKDAWRAVRTNWEQCEGFLIGPVEDDNYDPFMDTWPTDHSAMQFLLNGTTPLTAAFLTGYDNPEDASQLTLRGFHPLEFLLWGTTGNRDANYTQREKEYMVALADDLLNNITALQKSWTPQGANFGNEIINAGTSSSRYTSKKDILKVLVAGLSDICGEVADGKMLTPFNPFPDSTITESPYSHNSLADFRNNIQGAFNVYKCSFNNQNGNSISNLVAVNNKTLDADIKNKFTVALNSFDGLNNITFEQAVYAQRSQVQTILNAINALKETLDSQLSAHIEQFVKD